MLTELSLQDALMAFVNGERVIVLNADDLVALSLDDELATLKSPYVRFLADRKQINHVRVDENGITFYRTDDGKEYASLNLDAEQLNAGKIVAGKTPKNSDPEPPKEKRKYTRKTPTEKKQAHVHHEKRETFDPGKCQALVNAGRDMHFLCVEFGMDESELIRDMQKHGIHFPKGGT